MLIDAIAELKDDLTNNNFQLTIYGPNRDGALEVLQKKIQEKLLNDIVFLKDEVFENDKIDVLMNTDVFIMTSRFEGMPMGLIEALSYGIPSLVTKGTNLAKEIGIANAGWIAENNINSIKDALRNMAFQRNFIEKGRNAADLSRSFAWGHIAKKSSMIYKKMIEV